MECTAYLSEQVKPNPQTVLKNIPLQNLNRIIFAHLNINSVRNKFGSLAQIINNSVDVLPSSEAKIDSYVPTAQLYIQGYSKSYRLDRTVRILLYDYKRGFTFNLIWLIFFSNATESFEGDNVYIVSKLRPKKSKKLVTKNKLCAPVLTELLKVLDCPKHVLLI